MPDFTNEEGYTEKAYGVYSHLFGRRVIYSDEDRITEDNIESVVNTALAVHALNLVEEDELYWYARGLQGIQGRHKEYRPEICNKVTCNTASQVVTFKSGYFLTKPAFYVSRREDEATTEKVKQLNEYIYASGKNIADNKVVDNFHTMGMGVLYVEPNRGYDADTAPVKVWSVDPRAAFVAYSRNPDMHPVFGVNMVIGTTKTKVDVFTEDRVFRLEGAGRGMPVEPQGMTSTRFLPSAVRLVSVQPNIVGLIPIIEYKYNANRMSAFEAALPLMDAYNSVLSNDLDGIEQFIQSLAVAINCEFEEGTTANTIKKAGMICLSSTGENKADFRILSESLDQAQTQITLENLYSQILDKCGVPYVAKQSGGTSDNGTAVYLRNGWASADTDARNTTDLFIESNRYFDRVFLRILEMANGFKINTNDFALRIERNSSDNLVSKTQAALNLRELGLAPQIALERSGVSNDPLTDIELSRKYIDQKWGAEQPEIEVVTDEQPA